MMLLRDRVADLAFVTAAAVADAPAEETGACTMAEHQELGRLLSAPGEGMDSGERAGVAVVRSMSNLPSAVKEAPRAKHEPFPFWKVSGVFVCIKSRAQFAGLRYGRRTTSVVQNRNPLLPFETFHF
jgi:hypothetical protein